MRVVWQVSAIVRHVTLYWLGNYLRCAAGSESKSFCGLMFPTAQFPYFSSHLSLLVVFHHFKAKGYINLVTFLSSFRTELSIFPVP